MRQDRTGVVALRKDLETGQLIKGRLQIPVGGICVLILGPGTSISSAAMTSCVRSGASILSTGGGGYPLYVAGTPLTVRSKWADAQAILTTSERYRRQAARKLYEVQLGYEVPDNMPIKRLRGIEGQYMKNLYKSLAAGAGIADFRRETSSDDPVNVALNIGNGILYGLAGSVCAAMGLSPSLGVIHKGKVQAFLFDLADPFKPSIVLPAAFQAPKHENDVGGYMRKAVRAGVERHDVVGRMFQLAQDILLPHVGELHEDDILLTDPSENDVILGHTNYG